MKLAQVAVGLVAFAVGGASAFLITRTVVGSGGGGGGLSTREGLVAATVEGVNTGDRVALLEIMVGPASDRVAALCDEEGGRDDAAREKRRAERVDDALDEAKRRRLVLDHVGDDHVEVIAKKGDEIDKHCKARVDVVKHDMEIALHDGKSVHYTAQLTAIELAGQWYLATIPLAVPVGAIPLKDPPESAPPAVAAAAPPDAAVAAAAPPPPAATPPVVATPPAASPKPPVPAPEWKPSMSQDALASPQAREVAASKAPPKCVVYIKKLKGLMTCPVLADRVDALRKELDATMDAMLGLQKGILDVHNIERECVKSSAFLRDQNYGC